MAWGEARAVENPDLARVRAFIVECQTRAEGAERIVARQENAVLRAYAEGFNAGVKETLDQLLAQVDR